MMDSAWPRMRARILAIAVAGAVVGAAAPLGAYAQPQRRGDGEAQPSSSFRRNSSHSQHPRAASAEKGARYLAAAAEKIAGFLVELAAADPSDMYE